MVDIGETSYKGQTYWNKCCLCQLDKRTISSTEQDGDYMFSKNVPQFKAMNALLEKQQLKQAENDKQYYRELSQMFQNDFFARHRNLFNHLDKPWHCN